jgi:hypothetical protein
MNITLDANALNAVYAVCGLAAFYFYLKLFR